MSPQFTHFYTSKLASEGRKQKQNIEQDPEYNNDGWGEF